MAYNEEKNIGRMMEAVLSQQLQGVDIAEIIVVASGCTDRTEAIVESFAEEDQRIRLLTQPSRSGKSSAVNLLLQHTDQDIIVLVNADTVPAPDAIEQLVAPFKIPKVGMTAGRPVPTNDPRTFMGFSAHLLWALHHQISLRCPKMGEMIAFRNFFYQIPFDSAVDEASIEPLIRGQGLHLLYTPDAVVHNRGPETVEDFLRQRRRIYAGHVYVRDTLGYRVSTMKSARILWLLLKKPGVKRDWRYFLWGPVVVALEAWARLLGFLDYHVWKRKHAVWEVVETTKSIITPTLEAPTSSGHS
jgi:cellulose synthase/poly-beta-1,6-N-acetylglucosamine synthase-like glycosyltransferase